MSAVCVVLAALLYVLIRRTRLGMMIRAGASNREMVEALGLDITLIYRGVFALGVALATFAGMIAAPASSVYPGMGRARAHRQRNARAHRDQRGEVRPADGSKTCRRQGKLLSNRTIAPAPVHGNA